MLSGIVDDCSGGFQALYPVDGFLHLCVKVLDAEADAIETELAQMPDAAFFDYTRIEFDRIVVTQAAP